MASCVYIESAVREHPLALQLEEPLFAQIISLDNGIISYPLEREREMIEFCETQLMNHIPTQSCHPCERHG